MNEWKEYNVAELLRTGALYIGDGYRAKNEELSKEGLPFARAGNINNGFLFNNPDCLPLQDSYKAGNKISQVGDVVFTSKGTVGRFAFVQKNTPRFVYSPQLCFWRSLNRDIIESRFLFYWMHSDEFWNQTNSVKDQTDMAPYVNLSDQRRMRITLPPLPEQGAIAGVLSSLDDKIDLLHRQNKTLEGMAEAIWRNMFVEQFIRHSLSTRTRPFTGCSRKACRSRCRGTARSGASGPGWSIFRIPTTTNSWP
ncbi:MAG: restriction endonuclease subunit S [Chloroflexi bacterium]|nr:restriction endonuclease subunit S [Chloroflexota bacterium]